MTLQQLTYFLAAAEHGSFTAAADVLHLARPSVSEQIAHLEAELGVALFVRAGRRLELTDAGRLLRPEAERTLAAAAEAADVVRRARTLTGGTASLGTFSTAHHLLLPGLVEDFVRRHPEVAVRVVGENSVQLADAVRAGRLEAGLVALPIDDEGLEVGAAVARVRGRLRQRASRAGSPAPMTDRAARRAPSSCCPKPAGATRTRPAASSPSAHSAPESRSGRGSRSSTPTPRSSSPPAASATRSSPARCSTRLGYGDRLAARAARPAAARDVRLHPAAQRAPLTRHARADDARRAAPRGAVVKHALQATAPTT